MRPRINHYYSQNLVCLSWNGPSINSIRMRAHRSAYPYNKVNVTTLWLFTTPTNAKLSLVNLTFFQVRTLPSKYFSSSDQLSNQKGRHGGSLWGSSSQEVECLAGGLNSLPERLPQSCGPWLFSPSTPQQGLGEQSVDFRAGRLQA